MAGSAVGGRAVACVRRSDVGRCADEHLPAALLTES
jgi:hypothetical protein